MDYQEALKQVRNKKEGDGFFVIKLSYDKEIILPAKDTIAFISSIGAAEELHKSYSSPPEVKALSMDTLNITPMSRKEYEQYKMAALLKVSLSDLQQMEESQ